MGHVHLAVLPRSRRWKEVVALLERDTSDDAVIIAASVVAADRDLRDAACDQALAEAVRLLAMVPHCARAAAFGVELRAMRVEVPDDPDLGDLCVGLGRALEPHMRNDFTEVARRVLLGTFVSRLQGNLPEPFAADSERLRAAVVRLADADGFSLSARAFFARLSADTLAYWLDRTLSAQIGSDRRFKTLAARDGFDHALDTICIDAAQSIDELAGSWQAAALRRDGTITADRAGAFAQLAFVRIAEELRLGDG
jgi:hypothetical protein